MTKPAESKTVSKSVSKSLNKSKINPLKSSKSLSKVIDKNELIKEMVQVCADDLSTINSVLQEELAVTDPDTPVKQALKQNSSVENKVQSAVDELNSVNNALKEELREREIIEQTLEEVMAAKDIATQASLHDSLTGLPNRVLFYDRLEHGLEQAKRHRWNLAVMFIDIDKFKQINDEYGHEVGDRVLLMLANRLKENTRSDDTVCRYGGDEFLYLLLEVKSERTITNIIKKLMVVLEMPCIVAGLELMVKASIGVSMYPKNGSNKEDLIKFADEAMYAAKQNKVGFAFA